VSATSLDSITEEYLGRLDAASWRLPPARRNELVAEVRAHVGAAMVAGTGDEAALRTVLENLGAPEEIAREAVEQEGLPQQPPARASGGVNMREVWTLLLLTFGGFFVGFGWLVGVVLLWTSPRWRTRDKWLATLVWPFGYAGLFVVLGMGAIFPSGTGSCTTTANTETCTNSGVSLPGWAGAVVLLVIIVAPVLVVIRLLRAPAPPHTLEP
jgi:hypothetical protein